MGQNLGGFSETMNGKFYVSPGLCRVQSLHSLIRRPGLVISNSVAVEAQGDIVREGFKTAGAQQILGQLLLIILCHFSFAEFSTLVAES